MKVFISVDMEGVSGLVRWADVITAGIDFGLAAFICAFMGIAFDIEITKLILVATYTIVLAVHGLMNTFGIRLVALLNDVSVWWHIAGVLIIFGLLFFVPDHHTSFSTIFSSLIVDLS